MGRVVSVNSNDVKEFRKLPREWARLIAGYGLEGDRHAGRPDRQVSLLNVETLRDLATQGIVAAAGALGENLTIEGVPLMRLGDGARLRVGREAELELVGERPACREMRDVHPEALRAMVGRAGRMARVLRGGLIQPGDPVEVIEDRRLAAAPAGAEAAG